MPRRLSRPPSPTARLPISMPMLSLNAFVPPRPPPWLSYTPVRKPCAISDQSPALKWTASIGALAGCHAVPDASRGSMPDMLSPVMPGIDTMS